MSLIKIAARDVALAIALGVELIDSIAGRMTRGLTRDGGTEVRIFLTDRVVAQGDIVRNRSFPPEDHFLRIRDVMELIRRQTQRREARDAQDFLRQLPNLIVEQEQPPQPRHLVHLRGKERDGIVGQTQRRQRGK